MSITKLNKENVRKILVIQLGPFGDVFLTTSYFEQMKKVYKNAKIFYLTKKNYAKIIENHPFIDQIITIEKGKGFAYLKNRISTIWQVRKEKFDIIIDQQNKPSTQQITFFSGAKYRVGYADGRLNFAYNLKAKRGIQQYSATRKFDIVQPLEIPYSEYKMYYTIAESSRNYVENWLKEKNISENELIVFSPGSPVNWKIWKPDFYAEVAKKLINTGKKVILLWGPGEKEVCEQIKKQVNSDSVIIAIPTTFNQGLAMLEKAKLLICNDGGMNHLATTVGVKTLALFGGTDPNVWSPSTVFSSHQHLYNENHNDKYDNSFGITPDEVFTKSCEIIDE